MLPIFLRFKVTISFIKGALGTELLEIIFDHDFCASKGKLSSYHNKSQAEFYVVNLIIR